MLSQASKSPPGAPARRNTQPSRSAPDQASPTTSKPHPTTHHNTLGHHSSSTVTAAISAWRTSLDELHLTSYHRQTNHNTPTHARPTFARPDTPTPLRDRRRHQQHPLATTSTPLQNHTRRHVAEPALGLFESENGRYVKLPLPPRSPCHRVQC